MTQPLGPYQPGRPCPACAAEGGQPARHERPLVISFGRSPSWPCSCMDGKIMAHMCTRCPSCGFAWIEELAPGTDAVSP